MHPEVFEEYERILNERKKFLHGRVLEIGAVPTSDSLLNIEVLQCAEELVGINLDGGNAYKLGNKRRRNRYSIVKGNANDMSCFPDEHFCAVLCNAVLEHDKFFWRTLGEINRVTKKGGLIVIGAPGYDDLDNPVLREERDFVRRNIIKDNNRLLRGTLTLPIHDWPGDYYRFSPQAFREVVFEKMYNVKVYSIMIPPRIIGIGFNKK